MAEGGDNGAPEAVAWPKASHGQPQPCCGVVRLPGVHPADMPADANSAP